MFDLELISVSDLRHGDKCAGVGRVSCVVPVGSGKVLLVTKHKTEVRSLNDVIMRVVKKEPSLA